MEVDNVAGNRNDLGSNGEEEPVPGGPVVAAHAGAMGEPDRAGRLLDDNFWEDNELQEGEPAGFLSSLNGSDDDTTDEEPAEEEDEEQEGEQRQQPEAATQEGGAEEVGPVFGVVLISIQLPAETACTLPGLHRPFLPTLTTCVLPVSGGQWYEGPR